jgi:hypothetical protein
MQFFALFLALLALVVVVAQAQNTTPEEFALSMQGHFNSSSEAPFAFAIKGNSQTITTLIKPKTDAVTFSVQPIIGAYAEARFNKSTTATRGAGSISFGTHLSREHTLNFYAVNVDTVIPGGATGESVVSNTYQVKGGSGAFEKHFGVITISSIVHTDNTVSAFLHGYVYQQ